MRVTVGHSTDINGECHEFSVQLEVDDPYVPDVMDDLTNRARDLFRLVMADARHDTAEHEKPAE